MSSNANRTPSGVPGLDELLDGGLPKGRVILILGEPGAGKTILASQFLYSGARRYNEKGVFVCLEEARVHLYKEMALFGWNFAELERNGMLSFVDATPLRLLPEKVRIGDVAIDRKDFSIMTLSQAITREVSRLRPARIAVDSITSLMIQYPEIVKRRTAIFELVGALVATGATCIMTSELKSVGLRRSLEMEEFLAHGVILLQSLRVGSSLTRMLQIEKMRETACDTQPRPYRITEKGIEVYPGETVFR